MNVLHVLYFVVYQLFMSFMKPYFAIFSFEITSRFVIRPDLVLQKAKPGLEMIFFSPK